MVPSTTAGWLLPIVRGARGSWNAHLSCSRPAFRWLIWVSKANLDPVRRLFQPVQFARFTTGGDTSSGMAPAPAEGIAAIVVNRAVKPMAAVLRVRRRTLVGNGTINPP